MATGTTVALGALVVTAGFTAMDGDEQRGASSVAATAATWPLVQGTPKADTGSTLSDVASTPDGTMWAVGGRQKSPVYKPILQRLSGSTWSDVALPASVGAYRFNAVSATSGSNLWVAAQLNTSGDSHALLRWNGTAWTVAKTPLSFQPTDIATAGPASTWAVSALAAKYWNGTAWADTPIDIKPRALAAVSPTSAWAVGWAAGQPATAHWNGTAWTDVPFPAIDGLVRGEVASTLHDVYATSGNDVWAVGTVRVADDTGKAVSRSLLAHWDGTKWSTDLGDPGTSLTQVASDGAGGIWVVSGGSTMRHRTAAGIWSEETLTQPAGTTARSSAIAVRAGTTTVWSVGYTSTDATRYADLAHWHSN